jgi:nucleoid DNA-binding protein
MAKAASKKRSKTEIFASIAESTGMSKKEVTAFFDALTGEIKKDLSKKGGEFTIPGLCKIVVQQKPATKERKGIDPFTKQERIFKAKPARKVVKLRALKSLKDMVA